MPWLIKSTQGNDVPIEGHLFFVHVPRCGGTSLMQHFSVPQKVIDSRGLFIPVSSVSGDDPGLPPILLGTWLTKEQSYILVHQSQLTSVVLCSSVDLTCMNSNCPGVQFAVEVQIVHCLGEPVQLTYHFAGTNPNQVCHSEPLTPTKDE
jgi:hypothetical protein